MASYQGTLRCEECSYEIDVHSDGAPDVNLTLEHRSKRDHYLVLASISAAKAEAALNRQEG